MSTLIRRLGLRLAGRRAALAGLLLMLLVPVVGTAQAAQAAQPALTPAALTAPATPAADPCDKLPPNSAASKYCKGENGSGSGSGSGNSKPSGGSTSKPDPCADIHGDAHKYCERGQKDNSDTCKLIPHDDAAYQLCMADNGGGAPSTAGGTSDPLDNITGDCKAAPDIEAPGEGLLGWIDSGPARAPAPRNPRAADADAYIYEQYGYAGLRWNTYDLGCGGSLRDPQAASDNGFANLAFTWPKAWTALTVVLRAYATSPKLFDSLNPVIEHATAAVRDAVYSPWISVSLLLLGTVIIYQSRKRNLPDIAGRITWALLVMTVATGVARYPVEASQVADTAINSTIGTIDQAFAKVKLSDSPTSDSPTKSGASQSSAPRAGQAVTASYVTDAPSSASGSSDAASYQLSGDRAADATAHGNMLVHSVLYQQWLRGELGSDDSEVARKYGFLLFDSQALTWRESRLPVAERAAVITAKQGRFKELASKIHDEDPIAYSHLTGKASGRLSASGIASFQAAASNLFSNAADLVIIGGKLMVKFLVVLFPALAVIGLHRKAAGVVRTAFNGAMAACVNIPIFAAGAGIDALVVGQMASPDVTLPRWLKVVIMLLVSYVLWRILRPMARLSAMINPDRNWLQDGNSAFTHPAKMGQKALKYYMATRWMRKILGRQADALEDIADSVGEPSGRDADSYAGAQGSQGPRGPWPTGRDGGGGRSNSIPAGSGGTAGPDMMDPLEAADFEADHSSPATGRSHYSGGSRDGSLSGDDIWDADAWYVEDLEVPRTPAAISPASTAGRSNGHSPGDLSAPQTPAGPTPLSPSGGSGSGARAELPSPRNGNAVNGSSGGHGSAAGGDLPGGPVPALPGGSAPTSAPVEGDRPYTSPSTDSGPRVVPPVATEDGVVYPIFDPTSGTFSVRDERDGGDDA